MFVHRAALYGAIVIAALAAAPGESGTISVGWGEVDHPQLEGYRVFHGPSAQQYDQWVDVGAVGGTTLDGLADCTTHHVAVKSRGADGRLSDVFSNEVSGWPRPEIGGVEPATVERGTTAMITVLGNNFHPQTSAQFAADGVTVTQVTVNDCGRLTLTLDVSASAGAGASDLTVINPGQVFGAAVAALEVLPDATAPAIASLATSEIGTSTAVVSWTTDEPADGRVYVRRAGGSAFRPSELVTEQTTEHSIELRGLRPGTIHEYYVSVSDAAGNESTASGSNFTTLESEYTYLRVEAEAADWPEPATVVEDEVAFSGAAVEVELGTPPGTAQSPAVESSLGIHIPDAGVWRVWLRLRRGGAAAAGWFAALDDAPLQLFSPTDSGAWSWVGYTAAELNAGLHTLRLGGQQPGVGLDRILITDDPAFHPAEIPDFDVSAPSAVASFTAEALDDSVVLHWTLPSADDLDRLVLRYTTDGTTPSSPIDGLPLLDAAASGPLTFTHTDVEPDVALTYSAFLIDESGNVSEPSTLQATPGVPLGQVPNVHRTDVLSD
ncbi:MAG: fibronectin type III domain-containing protein [bacterium]|nr:fibronectin type III domain-containing protein [bacterium]